MQRAKFIFNWHISLYLHHPKILSLKYIKCYLFYVHVKLGLILFCGKKKHLVGPPILVRLMDRGQTKSSARSSSLGVVRWVGNLPT